jgi:hypothetical protein
MSGHEHGSESASTDSAGLPWAGRTFQSHDTAYAADDGTADPALVAALRRFHAGDGDEVDVLEALRGARLLIPLIAHAGDEGVGPHGLVVDKTQELSIVTVAGPDGRAVLPAFTSVETLRAWDPAARPVPAESRRVALAAASEQTQLMVLDPVSSTEFGLRRPALWALAQEIPWHPAALDEEVAAAFRAPTAFESSVAHTRVGRGAPASRLEGPEVSIELGVKPGLDREALSALLARLQDAWAREAVIADRVDSMAVRIVPV